MPAPRDRVPEKGAAIDADAERRLKTLGIEIVQEPEGAAIRQAWNRTEGIAVIIGLSLMGLFVLIVGFAAGMFKAFAPVVASSGWTILALFSPFLLVILIVLYQAACNLKNYTTYRVEDGRLTIRSGPLPFKRHRTYAAADIDQIWIKEISDKDTDGDPFTYHRLCLLTKGGRDITLVKKLDSVEQARALEKVLEERLRIGDRPVEGEAGRTGDDKG
jgi:hypothetical protein